VFRLLARGDQTDANLPYEKAGPAHARRALVLGCLSHAVDSRYPIFAKVRLGDLLTVPRGTLKFWTHRNRIHRKHVDFVLCAPDDLTPLLAIELDDGSHARLDRRARDACVDAALGAAGLPILHVPAQHAYAPAELRTLIDDHLNDGLSHQQAEWEDAAGSVAGGYHDSGR
jgi:very-short-patch-repair endonuclease